MIRTIVTALHPDNLYQELVLGEQQGCLKYFGKNIIGCCQFDGHCNTCTKHIEENNTFDYCAFICSTCKSFRECDNKEAKEEAKKYYDKNISKNRNKLQEKPVINNKSVAIINNNLTINNIHNTIVNNYIQTKDLFFYVVITSNLENAENKLRYMFTYLMCGASGIKLFPNEKKYSKALTFPVVAAKYYISECDNVHTLHGVLRYKHITNTTMTAKKLEGMSNNNVTVKVYAPSICGYNKHSLLKTDVDNFISNVINSDNGSDIEDFYIQD